MDTYFLGEENVAKSVSSVKFYVLFVSQEYRNRVFHDFRNGLCRNLVCTGEFLLFTDLSVSDSHYPESYRGYQGV